MGRRVVWVGLAGAVAALLVWGGVLLSTGGNHGSAGLSKVQETSGPAGFASARLSTRLAAARTRALVALGSYSEKGEKIDRYPGGRHPQWRGCQHVYDPTLNAWSTGKGPAPSSATPNPGSTWA